MLKHYALNIDTFVMKMQKWSYTFSQAKETFIHVPEMFIHVAIQRSYHTQSSGYW